MNLIYHCLLQNKCWFNCNGLIKKKLEFRYIKLNNFKFIFTIKIFLNTILKKTLKHWSLFYYQKK